MQTEDSPTEVPRFATGALLSYVNRKMQSNQEKFIGIKLADFKYYFSYLLGSIRPNGLTEPSIAIQFLNRAHGVFHLEFKHHVCQSNSGVDRPLFPINMPQNEYIEQAIKRHGNRLDYYEKR